MIETHTNLLNNKVMNKLKKYYDQLLKGQIDRKTFLEKVTKSYKNKTWWELYDDSLECSETGHEISFDHIRPSDSDKDVRDIKYDFMTSHTYDNGLPLTGINYPPEEPTEWNDYFDHFDRDQEMETDGTDDPIDHIGYDGENEFYYVVVQVTTEEFTNLWIESYDNSSYEHDFG